MRQHTTSGKVPDLLEMLIGFLVCFFIIMGSVAMPTPNGVFFGLVCMSFTWLVLGFLWRRPRWVKIVYVLTFIIVMTLYVETQRRVHVIWQSVNPETRDISE